MAKKEKTKKYRIFISYRGSGPSYVFAEQLYKSLTETPDSKKWFGNVFFSPEIAIGNFRKDIRHIMKDVKYFILPMHKGFFDDFSTSGGSVNNDSITYKEIKHAIKNGTKIVPVFLDSANFEPLSLKAWFGSDYTKILCANRAFSVSCGAADLETEWNRIIGKLCKNLVKRKAKDSFLSSISKKKNINMQFRMEIEDDSDKRYYEGFFDCKKVTLLNLASSSFLSGTKIAGAYRSTNWLHNWYESALLNGDIETRIVLLDPLCNAAIDAEKYKMFPRGLNIRKNGIITNNLEKALTLKAENESADIRVYLTQIAIPFAERSIEYDKCQKNYIKVDIYAPLVSNDDRRPSFYVTKNDKSTERLYDFYRGILDRVILEADEIIKPDYRRDWLTDKNTTIAHRAKYDKADIEFTKTSYNKCLAHECPMEVDILVLKDGALYVGRDAVISASKGAKRYYSDLDEKDYLDYHSKNKLEPFMSLKAFLALVNGKVPLLIEIKMKFSVQPSMAEENLVDNICNVMKDYHGEYAIHSSNPYILKIYREKDKQVRLGQIVFDPRKKGLPNTIVELFLNRGYLDIFKPDFISCRVDDIHELYMLTYCWRNNTPLLGWDVTNDDQYQIGKCCDNLIVN